MLPLFLKNKYFLKAFDETWEETREEFGAVNITGFRMIDPNKKLVKDFLHKWSSLDKRQFEGAGKRSISVRHFTISQ